MTTPEFSADQMGEKTDNNPIPIPHSLPNAALKFSPTLSFNQEQADWTIDEPDQRNTIIQPPPTPAEPTFTLPTHTSEHTTHNPQSQQHYTDISYRRAVNTEDFLIRKLPLTRWQFFLNRLMPWAKIVKKEQHRQDLIDSIRRKPQGKPFIVTLLRDKGGIGATTFNIVLGSVIASKTQNETVCGIEANFSSLGGMFHRISREPTEPHKYNIYSLAHYPEPIIEKDILHDYLFCNDWNYTLLPAPPMFKAGQKFTPQDFQKIINYLKKQYFLLLIDAPSSLQDNLILDVSQTKPQGILPATNALIFFTDLTLESVLALEKTKIWCKNNGLNHLVKDAILVVNQRNYNCRETNKIREEIEAQALDFRGMYLFPYDPALASGGAIDPNSLRPKTIDATLEIAAALSDIYAYQPRGRSWE